MRKVARTAAFKRVAKKMQRQGKDMNLLGVAILLLAQNTPFPSQYNDHALKGTWKGCREAHIQPDWLLIYHIEDNIVYLDRTGSHTELLNL